MVHQDDAEAWEFVAGVGGEVNAELVFSEEEMALVCVVAAKPGGVEADDVNG